MGQGALVLRLTCSCLLLAASIGLSSNSHEGNCELGETSMPTGLPALAIAILSDATLFMFVSMEGCSSSHIA